MFFIVENIDQVENSEIVLRIRSITKHYIKSNIINLPNAAISGNISITIANGYIRYHSDKLVRIFKLV